MNNDPLGLHAANQSPHLMQYLWDKYLEYLDEEIAKRAANNHGITTTDLETAKKRAPATHFVTWASEFLQQNRVVENFFTEGNNGLRLSNGEMVVVCPPGDEIGGEGSMQPSNAVAVTHGHMRPADTATPGTVIKI